jgi:itaconate CoA-transferase
VSQDLRPLAGVTVVAVEQAVAAPFATRILADYGARVIKVERPDGGDFARHYDSVVNGMSSHFVWVNRSKQSIALDLRNGADLEVVERMLETADVFVQNLGPGAAKRLGLDPEELRERHPRLVVCSITGYGEAGPLRDRKAYDLLIQCETGVLSVTGTPDEACKVGISVADIAGGMYAAQAIVMALYRRERTGHGARVDVSLFDALADWMGFPAYFTAYSGRAPERNGAAHSTIAPYGPFAVGDGTQVFIGVQNAAQWVQLCKAVLGDSALATDERFVTNENRVLHRAELTARIERSLMGFTRDAALDALDAAGVPCASFNSVSDFLQHPQLISRGRLSTVNSPVGELLAFLPSADFDDFRPSLGPIPKAGEHTDELLREFGFPQRANIGAAT